MIIPPTFIISHNIIRNLISPALQVQPCGIDLTISRVFRVRSAGIVDFDNSRRVAAAHTEEIVWPGVSPSATADTIIPPRLKSSRTGGETEEAQSPLLHLPQSTYRITFNETVRMPLDIMGAIYTRSSLWRSLAWVEAGVMDAGYEGGIGAALVVSNEAGLWVGRNAKVAQMVFWRMEEGNEGGRGYGGVYQGGLGL